MDISLPPLHDSSHKSIDPFIYADASSLRGIGAGFQANSSTNSLASTQDTDQTTDKELENQITTLCAMLAATEYRFLCLLAEFDRRGAWEGDGTRSCAHWLNWRCGLNLGAAREKIRVAHALEGLPLISAAFEKGQLSYSKVRAMTRIATPELEEDLLVTAEHGSASHIEQLVRVYRHCESPDELAQERQQTNQRHYTRSMQHYWNDDGCLVINATLPPEQGALVLKALEAATESLRKDEQFDSSQGLEQEGMNNDAEEPETHTLNNENTIERVSAETPNQENTDQRSDQRDTQSSERRQARRADAMCLIARDWLSRDWSSQDQTGSRNADRYQVVVNVDADILANKTRPGPSEQVCSIDDMHSLPVDTVRRLSCDCGVLGVITRDQQPLSVGRKTRSIPPAIRRALIRRDHGCTFPGCTATHYVEAHHLEHWANGGETSMENLTLLCTHHHHLMHEGDYRVERDSDGKLNFFDPRGRYIDPKQTQPDDVEYRFHVHRLQSLGIDENRLWHYSGDRMDYSQAIEGLIIQRDKAQKQREKKFEFVS